MKRYGLRPHRKRGKKFKYNKAIRNLAFPNLLLNNIPEYPNHIWASDFTNLIMVVNMPRMIILVSVIV